MHVCESKSSRTCVCDTCTPSYRECLQTGDSFYKRISLSSWAAEAVTASPTRPDCQDSLAPEPACPACPLPAEDSLSPPDSHWAVAQRCGCQFSPSPEEDPRGHPAHRACPSQEGKSLQSPAVTQTETASSCFSRTR